MLAATHGAIVPAPLPARACDDHGHGHDHGHHHAPHPDALAAYARDAMRELTHDDAEGADSYATHGLAALRTEQAYTHPTARFFSSRLLVAPANPLDLALPSRAADNDDCETSSPTGTSIVRVDLPFAADSPAPTTVHGAWAHFTALQATRTRINVSVLDAAFRGFLATPRGAPAPHVELARLTRDALAVVRAVNEQLRGAMLADNGCAHWRGLGEIASRVHALEKQRLHATAKWQDLATEARFGERDVAEAAKDAFRAREAVEAQIREAMGEAAAWWAEEGCEVAE